MKISRIVITLIAHFLLISGKYCPGTFDGWLCWPDTEAGNITQQPCPTFITGFDPDSKIFKI